ncbi:MAG: hypothetical protein N3D20_02160 [Candidatus Pacearchaeota archaeon]|nr:hypothetical protein [Candidatus Pacearchaeota archaeon]
MSLLEKIGKKARNSVLGLTAIAGGLLNSGCFPLYAAGSAASSYNAITAGSVKEAAAWGALSSFQGSLANREAMKEAVGAREPKVIIVERQRQPEEILPTNYFFVFNTFEDTNKNGCGELDEYIGRGRNVFTNKEPISFCVYDCTIPGTKEFSLKRIDGKIIYEGIFKFSEINYNYRFNLGETLRCLPIGTYIAKLTCEDGTTIGVVKFEVVGD